MKDCLFCKFVSGEIKTSLVYEDESVIAFRDINPQAAQHILIVPRKHFDNVTKLEDVDRELAAHIFVDVVPTIAKKIGVDESGFRLVINTGKEGGQSVNHLHIHLIGGEQLTNHFGKGV